MTAILLCYIAAFLLSIAGFAALYLFLRKKLQVRLRWGMFSLGIITAVIYFLVILLLYHVTFNPDYYYNTPFFRSMVGMVFLALLCLIRLMLVKFAFFGRYNEQGGYSFCFGFGAAPGAFLTFYLLFMTLVVAGNGLFNGPCIVESEGYLSFADNTIISIFRPAAGHISFALVFFAFAAMEIASACLLHKISEEPYHPGVSVAWVLFAVLLEAGAILPIPFISMYGLAHWQLAVIVSILSAVSISLVRFIPKKSDPSTYTKQFE